MLRKPHPRRASKNLRDALIAAVNGHRISPDLAWAIIGRWDRADPPVAVPGPASEPADPVVSPAEPATGVELIAAERHRQIDAEGWTPEHDDIHDQGELALAAACYAIPGDQSEPAEFPTYSALDGARIPALWPWNHRWYKRTPRDRKRELVKAGALIAAEIDRLQRNPDAR